MSDDSAANDEMTNLNNTGVVPAVLVANRSYQLEFNLDPLQVTDIRGFGQQAFEFGEITKHSRQAEQADQRYSISYFCTPNTELGNLHHMLENKSQHTVTKINYVKMYKI